MYDLQMNKIDFPDGFSPLDIFISSAEKFRQLDQVEASNRKINKGSYYSDRDIRLEVLLKAEDTEDYRLLRDETYSLFNQYDSFYVSEAYQPGKRYLVTSDIPYIPDRIFNNQQYATVDIICTKIELPFAESIGTTQDIEQNGGITYDSELWSFGMGLLHDDESHKYTHNTTTFSIYNAGNVEVHPFEQYLKITIENAGKNYELKNITTGDKFKYTGDVTGTLKLDGPNITLNNLQTLRDTNKEFITLAPGWNHFEQNQARIVEFDFRFYYS